MAESQQKDHPADAVLPGRNKRIKLPLDEPGMLPSGKRYILLFAQLKAEWSKPDGLCGEEVELLVEVNLPDGTPLKLEVFQKDTTEPVLAELEAKVEGGRARVPWTWSYDEDKDWDQAATESYVWPEHYFTVTCPSANGISDMLRWKDVFDATLVDPQGQQVLGNGVSYTLMLPTGTRRQGKVEKGRVVLRDVPPGPCRLTLEVEPQPRSSLNQAYWNAGRVEVGDEVTLNVQASELDGAEVTFRIYEQLSFGRLLAIETLTGQVAGTAVHVPWTTRLDADEDGEDSPQDRAADPILVFFAEAGGCEPIQSGLLRVAPEPALTNAQWGVSRARCGEKVTLRVDAVGLNRKDVVLEIYEKDKTTEDDFVEALSSTVIQGRVEATWTFKYMEDSDDEVTDEEEQKGYTFPEYYFVAKCEGQEVESGLILYEDVFDAQLVDDDDMPVAGTNTKYKLVTTDGTEHTGRVPEDGRLLVEGIPPGPCELELETMELIPRWSVPEAVVGDEVTLELEALHFDDGTPVQLKIYERDTRTPDDLLATLEATIQDGKASATWTFDMVDDSEEPDPESYHWPEFHYLAEADGVRALSDLLRYTDRIEFECTSEDEEDPLAPGTRYRITLADGMHRVGTLDAKGGGVEESVPPGPYELELGVPASAHWSGDLSGAKVGDEVELEIQDEFIPDGTIVSFRIYERDADNLDDVVTEVYGTAEDGVARATWTCEVVEDSDDEPTPEELALGNQQAELYFLAHGDHGLRVRSPLLMLRDRIEITVA